MVLLDSFILRRGKVIRYTFQSFRTLTEFLSKAPPFSNIHSPSKELVVV